MAIEWAYLSRNLIFCINRGCTAWTRSRSFLIYWFTLLTMIYDQIWNQTCSKNKHKKTGRHRQRGKTQTKREDTDKEGGRFPFLSIWWSSLWPDQMKLHCRNCQLHILFMALVWIHLFNLSAFSATLNFSCLPISLLASSITEKGTDHEWEAKMCLHSVERTVRKNHATPNTPENKECQFQFCLNQRLLLHEDLLSTTAPQSATIKSESRRGFPSVLRHLIKSASRRLLRSNLNQIKRSK